MTWELSGEYKGGGRRIGCEQGKMGSRDKGGAHVWLESGSVSSRLPAEESDFLLGRTEFLSTQQDIPNEVDSNRPVLI